MTEAQQVFVQLNDGTNCECTLEISIGEPCVIVLNGAGYSSLRCEADDLFDTLIAMRTELAKSGHKILCNGARKDVWPSGMSRSMGAGRKAYIVRNGQPARMSDLVDIFEYAESRLVVTPEQQRQYFEAWITSLK